MTKKAKCILIPTLGVVAATAIITPVVLVSMKKGKKNADIKKNKTNEINEGEAPTIFPKIVAQDYYKFVRINNKGAFLDDKIVFAVFRDIIKNLHEYEQKIEFDYKFSKDKKKLTLYFRMNFVDSSETKEYSFEVDEKELYERKLILKET